VGVAAVVNPAAGLAFLGAQGDAWDAQKDMAMAGLGSVVAMALTYAVAAVVEPDTWAVFKQSLRVPPDDRPVGEDQVLAWWRRGRG
jgi:putative membrane protein